MNRSLLLALAPAVTWIKVDKPVFDLTAVVLNSFRIAGILLVLALLFGLLLGAAMLRSRRRTRITPIQAVSLNLDGRA